MENQSAHKGVVDSKLLGVAKGYFHSPKQDFILNNPAKDMSKGGFVKAQLGKMASIQLRSMVIWKAPMCYLERRKPVSQ